MNFEACHDKILTKPFPLIDSIIYTSCPTINQDLLMTIALTSRLKRGLAELHVVSSTNAACAQPTVISRECHVESEDTYNAYLSLVDQRENRIPALHKLHLEFAC